MTVWRGTQKAMFAAASSRRPPCSGATVKLDLTPMALRNVDPVVKEILSGLEPRDGQSTSASAAATGGPS